MSCRRDFSNTRRGHCMNGLFKLLRKARSNTYIHARKKYNLRRNMLLWTQIQYAALKKCSPIHLASLVWQICIQYVNMGVCMGVCRIFTIVHCVKLDWFSFHNDFKPLLYALWIALCEIIQSPIVCMCVCVHSPHSLDHLQIVLLNVLYPFMRGANTCTHRRHSCHRY